MRGPVDERRHGPVRLLPAHAAPQPLLGRQGSLRVLHGHVDEQPRLAGEGRVGTLGTRKMFDGDLERGVDVDL